MSSDCFDPVVEVNKRDTSCTGGTGRHNQASLNPPVPVFMLNWVDHLPVLASYLTHRWEWHQSSNLTLCYNVNKHIAKSISCFLLMRHRGSIWQFALLKENMKMCEFSVFNPLCLSEAITKFVRKTMSCYCKTDKVHENPKDTRVSMLVTIFF